MGDAAKRPLAGRGERDYARAMASVSVIVLTRNRLNKLEKLLAALEPQLARGDEVVVVDTGSTDGTRERFAGAGATGGAARVRLVAFDAAGGWAEARNFGVDQARNPYLAFLDDDCYPASDWMERGRAGLERWEAVGGLALPHRVERWPEWWDPEMGWLVGLSTPGHLGPEAGRYYYPYTANLWIRAEVARAERFQEIGGARGDSGAEHYAAGREDAELWRRLRVRGHFVAFDSELRVEHDFGAERIDLNYLSERARRDGEAWARREGVEADLIPVAYQWWSAAAPPRESARPTPENGPFPAATHAARMKYFGLMRTRQGAALRALAEKISAQDPHRASPPLLTIRSRTRAGLRFGWDQAKTLARRLALAFSPPRPWIEQGSAPAAPPDVVAVAAFGFVGDMILLQGFLRGLTRAWPELRIHLLAPAAGEFIFRGVRGIEFRALPESEPRRGEARPFLAEWLTRAQPKVVIAPYLHTGWGSALVRLIHDNRRGAPLVAFEGDQELARRIDLERITRRVKKDLTLGESVNLERLFAEAKLPASSEAARFEIGEESRARAAERMRAWTGVAGAAATAMDGSDAGGAAFMLNPHAGKRFKEWTNEGWAALAREMAARIPGAKLLVNFARPDEAFEAGLNEALSQESGRLVFLRGEPLEDFAASLALCMGIVTIDSAPQHMARALGVPSLTLYGPMDERRWADPRGAAIHHTARGGMFDLTPEELRGLPENHLMRLLTPEKASAGLGTWLAATRRAWHPAPGAGPDAGAAPSVGADAPEA